MKILSLPALIILLFATGCMPSLKKITGYYTADSCARMYARHIIEVDKNSRHKDRNLVDGKKLLQPEHFTSILDGMEAHLASGNKKILIFFHGGLRGRKSTMKTALVNIPCITHDSIYPVFVNWNSSGPSSYFQQLTSVSAGLEYSAMKVPGIFIMFGSDILTGVARSPQTYFNNLDNYFNNLGKYGHDGKAWTRVRKNSMAIYSILEDRMAEDPENAMKLRWGKDDRHWPKSTLLGAYSFVALASQVGLTQVYDGVGTQAWLNMKRRASGLFHPPYEFDVRHLRNYRSVLDEELDKTHQGVLALFIDSLSARLKKYDTSAYEITIMGHSMGAIVANELIQQYPDLPVKNIVHMAAASSIAEVNNAVVPYLQRHNTKFYNLVLHPAAENREHDIWELFIPRGSLLVHIDNMFEQTAGFMNRRSGKWENMIQATHIFPDSVRNRVTIKSFDVRNKQTPLKRKDYLPAVKLAKCSEAISQRVEEFHPQRHGQFDDDLYWKQEFWEVK